MTGYELKEKLEFAVKLLERIDEGDLEKDVFTTVREEGSLNALCEEIYGNIEIDVTESSDIMLNITIEPEDEGQ